MSTPTVTREKLAAEFTRHVLATLSTDEVAEVVRKNATKEYLGCCATHDYYDSNMLMLSAYAHLAGITEDEVDLDASIEMMNEAWDLAKLSRFELLSTIIARRPNMQLENTGGGCMAYMHPFDDGGHLLITSTDGPGDEPTDDDYSMIVGCYDRNGDCIGGDHNTPEIRLCELEAWIDARLKEHHT